MPRKIEADAATPRRDMAFERGAGAEGDDRGRVLRAELDDAGDLFGRERPADRMRAAGWRGRIPPAVMLAVGQSGRETGPEQVAQRLSQRRIEAAG